MSEKNRRVQRVEKELREIVSTYLVQQQSGSSHDLISLTNIIVSPDLRHAKAFVCIIGKDRVDESTLEDLQTHAPEIQRLTSRQLRMKYCPKIQFYNDDSVRLLAKMDQFSKSGLSGE